MNETVARRWWGAGSPVGDRLIIGRMFGEAVGGSTDPPREVVGVAADTKSIYLKDPPRPTVYVPTAQAEWMAAGMSWVVRGKFPAGFGAVVRRAVNEADPRQEVQRLITMDEIVASTTADRRFDAWLFGSFAGLAVALAAIGVYGLLSYSVARRTHEIGTRIALGASRRQVLGLVLKQGAGLVATGLAAGLAGAAGLARSLSALLFGVRHTDPGSYPAVVGLVSIAGLAASYVPARRAARVDPATALRCE